MSYSARKERALAVWVFLVDFGDFVWKAAAAIALALWFCGGLTFVFLMAAIAYQQVFIDAPAATEFRTKCFDKNGAPFKHYDGFICVKKDALIEVK